ncbi:TolC family protein [Pseudacidovorax intermedius]|nr:TolC family protein [Pseudacidovorax intermedius]
MALSGLRNTAGPLQAKVGPANAQLMRRGRRPVVAVFQAALQMTMVMLLAAGAVRPAAAGVGDDVRAFVADPLGAAAMAQASAETEDACPRIGLAEGVLTLHDAVARMLCLNPRVRLARAGVMAEVAALGQARSAYLPRLSATFRRLDDVTAIDAADRSTSNRTRGESSALSLTWRLLDPGGRDANIDAAADLLAAALSSRDATVLQVTGAGIQAYFDVQAAHAALEAHRANREVAHATLASVERKQGAGAAAEADRLQAITAQARAELEVSRAQGALAQARAVLATWTSLPPQLPFMLPALAAPESPQVPALDPVLSHARLLHPAVAAARLKESAARAQVDAARAEGRPTLDLVAAEYRNGRPDQSLSTAPSRERQMAVVLTVPLFEGFERSYRIRAAQAVVEQREAQAQEESQKMLAEIVQAHAALAAAGDTLRASGVLFESAGASHASALRRFRAGAADLREVLNTQQTLDDARLQRVRSVTEWHAASLRLAAAAGNLGPELLRN